MLINVKVEFVERSREKIQGQHCELHQRSCSGEERGALECVINGGLLKKKKRETLGGNSNEIQGRKWSLNPFMVL